MNQNPIFSSEEGQGILASIKHELPPSVQRIAVVFITALSQGTDFIWEVLPDLVKLSSQESELIEHCLWSAAASERQKGRTEAAATIEHWANAVAELRVNSNFKYVARRHVPAASEDN